MIKKNLKYKTIAGIKISAAITIYKGFFDLGANLILLRLLAPEIFGSMAFAFLVVNVVGTVFTVSSSNAVIQRKEEKIETYLDVAFTTEIFLSIFASLILFNVSPVIMHCIGKSELSSFVQMLSLTLPINKLTFPAVIFTRNLDFKKANIAPAISIPVSSVVTISLAVLGFGIWSFFWGVLISGMVSVIVVWSLVPYRPKIKFESRVFKDLSRFGLPLTGSSLLAYYYWNVDDFMVGTILNTQQLGYYWFAFKIPHYILTAQNSIASVIFPSFARMRDNHQLKRGFQIITRFSAIILLLPCAVILVLGEPIIRFIFGEKWLPALVPFQIFMVLITVRGIVVYWTQVLMVKEKTNILFKITIQNAVVLTLLGYWLTKAYGIMGTSMAVLSTIVVSLPYMIWHLKKCIDVQYIGILWQSLATFTIILSGGLFLNVVLPTSGIYIVFIKMFIMVVAYIVIIVLFITKFLKLYLKEAIWEI